MTERPYYDPITNRCPHGTRYPHECRECEETAPGQDLFAWRRAVAADRLEGLTLPSYYATDTHNRLAKRIREQDGYDLRQAVDMARLLTLDIIARGKHASQAVAARDAIGLLWAVMP